MGYVENILSLETPFEPTFVILETPLSVRALDPPLPVGIRGKSLAMLTVVEKWPTD